MQKPIITSALVCAFKYNLEVATKPIEKINRLKASVILISKCILRLIKNINRLPIPNKCILLFILNRAKVSELPVSLQLAQQNRSIAQRYNYLG